MLVGVAASVFPVVLTLIGLRARTSEGTAALSGFTQSVGYLIAAIGPFGMGLLYDLTGGWTVPLVGLIVLVVPQLAAGLTVARPSYIEDEIGARARALTRGSATARSVARGLVSYGGRAKVKKPRAARARRPPLAVLTDHGVS